jgi:Domain of unknown function (DUF4157)
MQHKTQAGSKDSGVRARRSAERAIAPGPVHEVLRSPGRPLDTAARATFEPRFGRTFADVRVHDDRPARESADAVVATAYTVGEHVVLGEGRGSAGTLAHELAHVAQAPRASVPSGELPVALRDAPAERAAEAAASAALAGGPAPARAPAAGPALHRQAKPEEKKQLEETKPEQKKAGEGAPGQKKPDEKKGDSQAAVQGCGTPPAYRQGWMGGWLAHDDLGLEISPPTDRRRARGGPERAAHEAHDPPIALDELDHQGAVAEPRGS